MNLIVSLETNLINFIIPIMALVIGIVLATSIFKNRLGAFYKSNLITKNIPAKFPFSRMYVFTFRRSEMPELIYISFKRSVGLYNGNITIINGEHEVGSYVLPYRHEFSNKRLRFFNEDILRQTNALAISVTGYNSAFPLKIVFRLNSNIRDSEFKRQLKFRDEDDIKICVRGSLVEVSAKETS